jgi:hypothetical protein
MTAPLADNPFDHNLECRYCDEQAAHRIDCPWFLQLVQEHAFWSSGAQELAARVDQLEAENAALRLDAERERTARRIVDEALRQQLERPNSG